MKKIEKYTVLCIIGMILLVIGALFVPRLAFDITDKYQMMRTQTNAREDINISQVSSNYEKQMHDRMQYLFTGGLYKAAVTTMDYDMQEEELDALLNEIYAQEWTVRLDSITAFAFHNELTGVLPVQVRNCKKYIVYKENLQDGLALMMWYLDLSYSDTGTRMRLLVDSETGSIYAIRITASDEFIKSKSALLGIGGNKSKEGLTEYIFQVLENGLMNWIYYCYYYEAENEQFSEYDDQSGAQDEWYISSVIEESCGKVDMYLPYGEVNAEFLIEMKFIKEKSLDFFVGLPKIADLVSEMLQD